mgnify:CR=1 FL=1
MTEGRDTDSSGAGPSCVSNPQSPDYGFKDDQTPGEMLQQFTEAATYNVGPPARMGDDELRKFVIGLLDNSIFTSAHIRDSDKHLMGSIFLPLMLGMFRYHSDGEIEETLKEVGVFWAYMHEAGPRAINGYPNFFSVRLMHIDDWRRAFSAYEVEMKRRDAIQLPP